MNETDVRTPRLAVWGFGFSLVGYVLSFGSFLGFAAMAGASAGGALILPWGVFCIPGLLLSVCGRRVGKKRGAPRGWATAGIVLGIVGTVVLVLYIGLWVIVLVTVSSSD